MDALLSRVVQAGDGLSGGNLNSPPQSVVDTTRPTGVNVTMSREDHGLERTRSSTEILAKLPICCKRGNSQSRCETVEDR